MSKAPSEATQIRTLKRRLTQAERQVDLVFHRFEFERKRADTAEQDAAEWKARFDVLLRKESP